jgi:uncharacterized membrane protein YoaK (UPF0700 family)
MRTAERDVLLLLLAVSAGSADAWSFVGIGHVFVANMTGNTVLLGIAVFQKNGDVLHPFLSLCCYAAGVATASFLTRKVRPGVLWSRAISWTLLIEALLMAGAETVWYAIHSRGLIAAPTQTDARLANALLASVALAIGLQSGAMLQLKIPGVVTTYITGTWTTLMNGLVRFFTRFQRADPPQQEKKLEDRLWMQSAILAVYLLSAVLTGWLFRYHPQAVGLVPSIFVFSTAVYGAFRDRDASGQNAGPSR